MYDAYCPRSTLKIGHVATRSTTCCAQGVRQTLAPSYLPLKVTAIAIRAVGGVLLGVGALRVAHNRLVPDS